jgi:D-proline reductase (dithiol) PrdB
LSGSRRELDGVAAVYATARIDAFERHAMIRSRDAHRNGSHERAVSRLTMPIDSYRYLDFAARQVMKAWAAREEHGVIPFTPLSKPLRECTVALLSTAGVARNDDRPFDQDGERRNPWWGDPSFRVLPLGTTENDVKLYHLHIDPRFGEADLDVVLPMRRLSELAREGMIGRPAREHYSIMGYILEPAELVETTAPAIAERMREQLVDAAVLAPA